MSVFRIESLSRSDVSERPKGYYSSYRFYRDDTPLYQCHANRWCTKPSEFIAIDGHSPAFILKSSRNILPMTWLVKERDSGQTYGSLKRKLLGKTDWLIKDANGSEVGSFRGHFKPSFWLFRVIEFFLGGNLPEGYEIVANGLIIARMKKEQCHVSDNEKKKKGWFNRLKGALTGSEWVIREQAGHEGHIDHRLLLAGAVLLEQLSRDISAP